MDKIRQMLEYLEKELRKDKQYSAADKLLPIIEEAGKHESTGPSPQGDNVEYYLEEDI